jgi:hypothetical protein
MRAEFVIITDILGNEVPHVPLSKDHKMIQAFVPNRPDPTLSEGIQVWRLARQLDRFMAVLFEDPAELRRELTVPKSS